MLLLCNVLPARAQECRPEGNLITAVSVITNPDGSEQTLITWDTPPGLPADAAGYIIYEYAGPPYCANPVHTIYDRTATSYTRSGFHPGGYTVAVYRATAPPSSLPQHHVPPVISAAGYDACRYSVSLTWSPYVGWDEPDITYNIYVLLDGQRQQLAGRIAGTAFLWHDAPDNKTIDFYVQAVRSDGITGDSPHERVTTATLQRPAAIDLSRLEYAGNEVRLNFHIDPATALTQFEVQRAADAGFDTQYTFSDKTLATYAESAGGAFSYRVAAKNDCGQIARVSDTLQNFMLDMTSQYDAWQLQWTTPASGQPYRFSLYRLPDAATLVSGTTNNTFVDPVTDLHRRQSLKYCYRLEATTAHGESVSEACAFYRPRIAMPDAVNPFGTAANLHTGRVRNQFGPITNAHPATYTYRLKIINRNGAKIADITKDLGDNPTEKSWNGCFADGAAVPAEAYTYSLEMQFEGGHSERLTGPVVVLYE
ncbi:MAG: hypothetical protein LBT49_05755 [Prevotellaceae bacterium]|nr:hypothetical protein [Prevotellaceae bacterium]